jgi:hypothetical protein
MTFSEADHKEWRVSVVVGMLVGLPTAYLKSGLDNACGLPGEPFLRPGQLIGHGLISHRNPSTLDS